MHITDVRKTYKKIYNSLTLIGKLKLKCWLYDSEENYKNKSKIIDFSMYRSQLNKNHIVEKVNLDQIDCSDLGGKVLVLEELNK